MKPALFLIIGLVLLYIIVTGKAQQVWTILNA